jgi:uncharacterized phage protein (TIGR01671 family)
MRTMRFRAWDSKNKKFPFVGFHIIGECTVFDLINQYRLEEFNDLIIEQFTGLKSEDGTEIYEGDIVQSHFSDHELYQIIWSDDDAAFITKGKGGSGAFLNPIYTLNFTVVGNIHENPDLIPKVT